MTSVKRTEFPRPLAGLSIPATGFRSETPPESESDGRRRRRVHNREAVVDALLDLYRHGNLRPSTDEIADRAQLSPRSLFRYFEDVDDLADAAVRRAQERAAPLVNLDLPADATRERRIKALVDQRFRIFDEVGHAATVVRLRAPFQPLLATLLAQNRALLREQAREVFSPELRGIGRARARDILAALDVLASFESYQLLQDDQGLSATQAKAAISSAIGALLDSATRV